MKHCVQCNYHGLDSQEIQGPGGRMGIQRIHVCKHPECSHPVLGEPLNCDITRQDERFCGWEAKYWVLKEVQDRPKQDAPKPLIEVSK